MGCVGLLHKDLLLAFYAECLRKEASTMVFPTACPALFPSVTFAFCSRFPKMRTAELIQNHLVRSSYKIVFPNLHAHALKFSSHVRAHKSEEEAAIAAAAVADKDAPTIFDKILKKEIPATVVYEDEHVFAFRDINPQAPVHILLIPKIRDGLTQLSKSETRHREILGHLMYTTGIIAKQEGIEEGYRVVINNGPSACQSVYHLHLHIIGGRQLKWPPG